MNANRYPNPLSHHTCPDVWAQHKVVTICVPLLQQMSVCFMEEQHRQPGAVHAVQPSWGHLPGFPHFQWYTSRISGTCLWMWGIPTSPASRDSPQRLPGAYLWKRKTHHPLSWVGKWAMCVLSNEGDEMFQDTSQYSWSTSSRTSVSSLRCLSVILFYPVRVSGNL